ncbi:pitrilysin family protein [Luteolibacter sp. LG18]|uniref:M16 family metallopeptidase n=1 Tax=Luteolibacter sp. LG18 TaxID=2819286 RepID=UPI002B2FA417|nr:peptidase M16 [Luteolibacter sp. LG18]
MEYPVVTATAETLPNGLSLILDPDPSAPVVSAQIWVETGSMHEGGRLGSGISHFLEHMVFKGTRDYDGEALANAVQAAGGHWNAYTSFDRTVYYIDGPAASLPEFLKILTGLVFFPTLPEAEFEKEKDVIRREIDMGLDDPDNVASRLLFSTTFVSDPRRHPVIGHRHLFDALSYDDLRNYHRTRYTPERAFAVVSGDFDADEVRKQITAATADLALGGGPDPLVPQDTPQIGPRRARATFAIPASRLTMAWKTPPLSHPDAPALDVLAALLGRGRSARLYRHLRQERELALEISAWAWNGPGREGLFAVSAEVSPDNREVLVEAALAEIAKVQQDELADELAKAKRQIAASQFRSLTSASGRAADLASNWHEARDLDFTRHYLAALHAVTPEDVKRVAAALTAERMTLTVLDPEGAAVADRATKRRRVREEIRTHTLDNGITLALLPDRRVPLLHFQAAVRAGLPSETEVSNGINQLLASTLPQGTATRSAEELALELESLGASIGASAGNNALLIQAAGLAPDFGVLADALAEVLNAPSLPSDAIAREKASQRAALEEALEDPLHTGLSELRKALFNGAGYGRDALGTRLSLDVIDRTALADHHRRHFTGGNLTLAVAGDFDPSAAADTLAPLLSAIPAGQPWTPPDSYLYHGSDLTFRLPKKQAVLAIGYPGAAALSEDRHALAMLQEYCTDMAGPLFTRIREDLGLAYQVGATQFLGFDTGMFAFYLATSPGQAELAKAELMAEIGKIAARGIPDDAFERVRSTVLSSLAIQQQSLSSTARQAAIDLLFGQSADLHRQLPDIYKALTPQSVRAAAERVFSVAPTLITVLPEE